MSSIVPDREPTTFEIGGDMGQLFRDMEDNKKFYLWWIGFIVLPLVLAICLATSK